MAILLRFVGLGLLIFLTACEAFAPQTVPNCPRVRVPADVGTMTRFVPQTDLDITDVTAEVEYVSVRGECSVSDEEVEVAALVEVAAKRGPAATQDFVEFEIFVAITDLDRNVLVRRGLPFRVEFSGNRSAVRGIQRLVITIPKTPDLDGNSFFIFSGFVLTEEELRYNRAIN